MSKLLSLLTFVPLAMATDGKDPKACMDVNETNNPQCHRNVVWAMTIGINQNASNYPPHTTTFADFQCSLHIKGLLGYLNAPGPQWNCSLPPCADLSYPHHGLVPGGTPAQRSTRRCLDLEHEAHKEAAAAENATNASAAEASAAAAAAAAAARHAAKAEEAAVAAEPSSSEPTWWGWLLVVLAVCLSLFGAFACCVVGGGQGKRGPNMKKPSKSTRAAKTTRLVAPEAEALESASLLSAPILPMPALQPIVTTAAPLPAYQQAAAPVYTQAPPVYETRSVAMAPAYYGGAYAEQVAAPFTEVSNLYSVPAAAAAYAVAPAAAATYTARANYASADYVVPAEAAYAEPVVAAGLSSMCPNCGNIFMEDSNFCRKCGQKRQ